METLTVMKSAKIKLNLSLISFYRFYSLFHLTQHLTPLNVSCYSDDFTVRQEDGTVVENVCFYRGQRSQVSTCQYENNIDFWRNLSISLAWVIGIILLMFAVQSAIQKWIPQKSRDIVIKVKKEAHYRKVILNQNVRVEIEKITKKSRQQQKEQKEEIKIILGRKREEEKQLQRARQISINLTSF